MKISRNALLLVAAAGIAATMALRGYATIINVNVNAYLGKSMTVPSTVKDAYGKCLMESGKVAVNQAARNLGEEMDKLSKELATPYGMDDMKKIGEEYGSEKSQAAIESMSMEEKIALGMKMQKQMGYGVQTGDQNVTKLMAEAVKLTNQLSALDRDFKFNERWGAIDTKYSTQHHAIDTETEESVDACPVLSSGEMSAPDIKCVRTKQLAGIDRHIALTDKELKEYQAVWSEYANKFKVILVQIDALMGKTQYGAKVSGAGDKNIFSQLQTVALTRVIQLHSMSEDLAVTAARLIADKIKIQKGN